MKAHVITPSFRRRLHRKPDSIWTTLSRIIIITAAAISPQMTAAITCRNAEGHMEALPESRINDGYCDCWETGQDETTTDACAGNDYWGSAIYTVETNDQAVRPFFQCPQQSELRLPVSRVNDGICDCCDGADETTQTTTPCPDKCAQIKAAEAKKRADLQERYTKGSIIRRQAVQAFQTLKEESKRQLATLQLQLDTEQSNLDSYTEAFRTAKQHFVEQRRNRFQQSTADGTFHSLMAAELHQVIVHACQLSGEMSLNGSECEALVFAALDVGIGVDKPLNGQDLIDILYHNAQHPDDRVFNIVELRKTPNKRRKKGRKLMRAVGAEELADDMADYEESFDDYSDDDHNHDNRQETNDHDQEESKSEQRKEIERLPFSETRVRFLAQAAELQNMVDEAKALRDNGTEASDEEGKPQEPEDLEQRTKLKDLVALDDKAFELLETTLSERKRVIERGFDFAESAKVSVDGLTDSSFLEQIALGTVYYGKLSPVHVYQILASILFKEDFEQETCTNVAGRICPPKTIVRNTVTLPSNHIVEAVTLYCDGASLPDGEGTCAEAGAIPTELPDGYAGYYEVFPREEDDAWHKKLEEVFATTEIESAILIDVADKEEKAETAEHSVKDLERRIKDIHDSIGSDDEGKFGPDGALHSIRSDCFSTKAGKYTYELCMYKKAAQKDGGSSTNLGQWAGASVEEEDGHIWRWEGGAKCWNGPKRSATAHVTCGEETIVLSADEPDTCRYVFQVRSPIACDDSFQQRYKLL